ncbi:MAG: DUF4249 domain-containing protein [Bacteroidales bacterium]|nr:DUF4249 domain-containing protein [Bacteroidales bacterium]
MRIAVYGLLLLLTAVPHACIEPYEAEIEEEVKVISIEGSIIKGEPVQTVVVTRTSPLVYPQFKPVKECDVSVVDDLDNVYGYTEGLDGTYSLAIPDDQLTFGRKYKLRVITPEGVRYESEFERLNSGAEVDSVYYDIEEKIDKTTGDELLGLQFYIDLKAADTVSRYFRWSLRETYEYTVEAPITYYFEDASLEPVMVDNTKEFFRCWKTETIKGLYLSNTVNLTINEKKRIPLHYVSTISDRLKIKYSLFVKQYTLNEGAYNYWQKNKIATQESGGLYTQQPGQPVTNIVNVNDSTEQVLGYFWISHKTEQRIFVPRINSLPVIGEHCDLVEFSVVDHGLGPFPVYIYVDQMRNQILTGSPYCFVCTLKGGSTEKPDFWE